MHLGMNIFNLFSGASEVDAAERQSVLARQQRLAMSLAVLTQLHIARVKFRNAEQQMRLVKEIADSDRHLARLVATNGQFLNKDFFEAVRLATRQMNSEMDEQRTFVELVSSHAEVMHAIGQDVLPDRIPLDNIPALAGAIRDMTATWYAAGAPGKQPRPAPARREAASMDRLVDAVLPPDRSAASLTAATEPGTAADRDGGMAAEEEVADEKRPEIAETGDARAAPAEDDGELTVDNAGSDRDDQREIAAIAPADGTYSDKTAEAAAARETPVAEAAGEPADIFDAGTEATADAGARLNDIAPASRGDATVSFRTSGEWELLPSPPYRPASPLSADGAGRDGQPGENYVVSLGAFSRQENAFKLHAEVGARSSGLFGGTAVRVVLRPGGNGATYYFVQTAPMPDRRAAVALCRSLKRAGRACNVSALAD
jgi:hypothetical protein